MVKSLAQKIKKSKLFKAYRKFNNDRILNHVIFVHINKTGGLSVSQALGIIGRQHLTALELKEKVGDEKFNSVFKFTFVRNPWDLSRRGDNCRDYYNEESKEIIRKHFQRDIEEFNYQF